MTNNLDSKNSRRILLVDDEPDITFTFKIGLEDEGFIVDAFVDPLLALSSFTHGVYRIALLDIKMPGINGFRLYEKIRQLDSKIKMYFLTAFEIQKEDLAELPIINREKPKIIKKPISLEELLSIIKPEIDSQQNQRTVD